MSFGNKVEAILGVGPGAEAKKSECELHLGVSVLWFGLNARDYAVHRYDSPKPGRKRCGNIRGVHKGTDVLLMGVEVADLK